MIENYVPFKKQKEKMINVKREPLVRRIQNGWQRGRRKNTR